MGWYRRWATAVPVLAFAHWFAGCAPVEEPPALPKVFVGYPLALDPQCRGGRAKLYDECSDQLALFKVALERANAEGKVLLVSFGAEWCIWCHVFDAYINGERTKFRYTYGSPQAPEARDTTTMYEREEQDPSRQADALREYVRQYFVVAHIDYQYAPNGMAVLEVTGAAREFPNGLPFIFTVDSAGRYAASFDHDSAESRRDSLDWYRGYSRTGLLDQLRKMRSAATASAAQQD